MVHIWAVGPQSYHAHVTLWLDDASSSKIEIHFHSGGSAEIPGKLPNLVAKCNKITFKNNGMAFRPEDWQRLKRIAEGNPGKFGIE
jgi:hypothetical protein